MNLFFVIKRRSSLLNLLFLGLFWLGAHMSYAQTPVTQYPCDPRSTANAGTCPVDCVFPANIEQGCNCFDNIDNDGDGVADAADPNCASYFGLEFVGEGSDCSIVPPGANTPFDLVGPPAVSGQNTADTQSKVAAGDVDGNGYPDVVITSKWNSEVRLVATAVQPGFSPGDVKADFNLDGNTGFFPEFDGIDVKNLLFEHEVLIADINKDGISEIFCVVSNRQGSPTSPPKSFYLLSLRFNNYGPGGLQPMYNAVYLGKNRPGTFGIADMDGDGRAEVYLRDRIFAAETGALLASEGGKLMTGTGTDRWDIDVTSAPVAVDIRSAGADGFVMELVSGSKIYKVPSLTNRNPGAPGSLTLWRDMNSISFDINADGSPDQYFVKLMNDPDEYGIDTHSSTSVADIDKDGFVDVVVTGALNSSTGRSTVFYWNVQDNTVTGYMTPTSAQLGIPNNDKPAYDNYLNGWIWGTGRVNIGDADGDGVLDLLFVAGNQLFCFTTNAANGLVQKWVRTINDSRSGVLTVTIYDFDNDGNPEVVYRDAQELAIVDGATGSNKLFSRTCMSHTYTEGPVIADVNGDGNTDICVSCNRSDNPAQFKIEAGIQQQALGEVRIFFSDGEWLPTRKVWNQPGYFVVNINDDLTLPFPQLDIAAVFSNTPCPNGIPGPQTPYNVFLNQVPFLSANGCPVFPAPDLTFIGQDPNDPLTDPTAPGYFPTVFAEPPICGNIDLKVGFNISNSGDLPINTAIPVSFFIGSPYDPNNTGTLLHSTTITVSNLQVGDTLSIGDLLDANGNLLRAGDLPFIEFDGPGTTFEMFVVLYNDGSVLPIDTLAASNGVECDIRNNFWPITIVPTPFTVNIDSIPNAKCLPTSPDNGGLVSHISIGADTVIDLSPYAFQWFLADGVTPAGTLGVPDTNYDIQGIPGGDYFLVITNTEKGCSSDPILGQVIDGPLAIPGLTVTKISDQTSCEPPNGELRADVTGGNAGFEFSWEDVGGPIGVTGPVLENVRSGTYTVVVTETQSGCSTEADGTILDFTVEPDLTLSAVDVVNCVNSSTGSVTARPSVGGVEQDTLNYRFDWYFFDAGTGIRGSILPGNTGNPTVKNLPVGHYEVVVTEIATGCNESNVAPDTIAIRDLTILPEASFTELAPQTSCDPLQPNGRLQANAVINGVVQNPADFTFEWFEGQNTITAHTGGTSGVNGQVAEGVKGGGQAFTVRITTANQCSVTKDTVINEIINYPLIALGTTPNSVCDQALGFTGSVSSTVTFGGNAITAGNPDYTFEWYDGPTATGTPVILNQQNYVNLDSGFYTLVVTNTVLNCPSVATVEQVLSIKALPVITTSAIPSTNCDPALDNGVAQVTDVDGAGIASPDYTFEWYDGNLATGTVQATTPAYGVNTPGNGLQGGAGAFFTTLVRNVNSGCENTATVLVGDASVLPVLTLAAQDNTVCDPALTNPPTQFTGSVTATVTNQVGVLTDYTFVFGGGNTAGVQANNIFSQLNGGPDAYTAVATHTPTGCVSSLVSIPVQNVQDLPDLTTASVASTNCVPGLENGEASVVTVDGVATPGATYTYTWTGPGSFPVTNAANNANTHQLIAVQGGAGFDYTVLVTNQANGCQSTALVNVADASVLPVITLAAQDNGICDPALTNPPAQFTGRVTATVTNQVGALTDYTFAFGGGNTTGVQTANVYDQLNGGPDAYTTVATHVPTGCVSSLVSIPVQNVQDIPDLTTSSVASTNCVPGLENGQASVVTVDGVAAPGATYTYAWTGPGSFPVTDGANNANTHQLVAVQGGAGFDYTVLVTNQANGCQATTLVNVADAHIIPVLTLTPVSNSICDPAIAGVPFNGQVSAAVNNIPGGSTTANYFFDWSTGTSGNGVNVLSGLDVGNYTVTALHNPTGCVSAPYAAQVSNAKVLPVITTAQTPSQNCVGGAPDGIASVTDVLPVGQTYDYRWFDGNTVTATPDFTQLNTTATTSDYVNIQGGLNGASLFQYTVEVTIRESGCVNTAIVGVDDDSQLPVVSLTSTDNENCVLPGNGTASVTALSYRGSAVAAPYTGFTFNWSAGGVVGPAPGDTYTALAAGSYTITVTNTDDNCMSNPVSVDVADDLFIPEIEIASVDQTSCDPANPNGELLATIDETTIGGGTGVTAGYTFQWTDDVTSATTATNQITGLEGNQTYTINVVRVSTGCVNEQVVTLDENITIPVLSANVTDMTVCVPPNGSISASVLPAATYDFFWYDGSDAVDENAVITGASQSGASSVYAGLVPGNYTVVARDVNTQCVSSLVIRTVNDASPAINLAITNVQLPTDCNAVNSQMDATANGVTAGFTFDWYEGVPQPTDPLLGSINYFTNPPIYTPPTTVGTGSTVNGLTSGLYTLEVTDQATGCRTYLAHSLPFQNSHAVIKITKTDSELCPYTVGNGSITIEIENPVAPPPPAGTDQTDYNVFLYPSAIANPPLATLLSPTNRTTEPVLPFLVSNTLVPGSYIVGVQETYSGSDCFIYQDVIIEAIALDPIITLASSVVSNTACDVTQFDGSIEINVDKDPNDPVLGLTYDIDMVSDPNNAFPLAGVVAGNYTASNLGPATYTFNVTASNGCTASRSFTVLDNPVVSQFVAGDLNVSNALYCDPLLEQNARVTLNSLSVIGGGAEVIADYEFAWDDVTNSVPNVFVAQGDALNSLTGGDEFINQTPLPASGTVPSGTVRAGTYRVRATKTADASGTGGIGCTSAPYTVTIGSTTVNPQLTLTPFGDTSCDPTFFEGSIEVDVVTPSGPGNGGTYTYNWVPNGGAGQPGNSAANSGVNNLFTNLNDGNYTLTAINELTGCSGTLSTAIVREAPPVFTLNASPFNLTDCGIFDGRIENIQVFVDGAPGVVADFDYTWFSGNLTTQIIDGLDDITHPVDDQLTVATYPAIALGSYFVKATRKAGGAGVGCESAPIRRDILDDRIFPQITLSQIENTACDGNFDGQITVTASTSSGPGSGANYDFVWTNDPDGAGALFSASDALNQASPYSTPNTDLIGPGSYEVQVTNVITSCVTAGTIVLQQNTVPMEIVSVTSTDVDVCLPLAANGSGTVTDVSIDGTTGQSGLFTYTWANNPGMTAPILANDPGLTLLNLDVGTFYVQATRNAVAFPTTPGVTGSGCLTAPVPFVVEDRRVTPSVSLSQVSNTACDGNFDGQITVTASTSSGPGAGANYDFVWTNDPDGAGALFSASDALNQASPYSTPNTDLIGPGSYEVQVTNFITSCATTGTIVLQQNTVPMEIVSVTSTDVDVCLPLAANGSGTVTDVSIDGTTGQSGLFTYTWANNPGMAAPILANDPGLTLLNLDVGTFYVQATRNAVAFPATPGATGSGCLTAPVPFVVEDRRVTPSVSLSQISNTACDGNFDGQITVTASTSSGPGAGANYDFVWTNDPDGAGALFSASDALNQASPYSTPNTDLIGPGSYTVQVTNVVTACASSGSVVLQQNDAVILVVDASKTDQDICDFDGSVLVEEVAINGVIDPDHNNFHFTWIADNPTNLPAIIDDVQGEDNLTVANHPTIQAGSYYVVARRADGLSGSGCESAPFRVDIQDISVNPIPSFQTFVNSSCTGAFLNGAIRLNVADNSGPGVGGLYDYEFTYTGPNPPAGVPPFQFIGNNGNGINDSDLDSLMNLGDGTYDFIVRNQVTLCETPAQVIIQYDPVASKPNIISVDTNLPFDCLGNGGDATVTAIRIGSNAPITGSPALDPPNFQYDWYDNATDPFMSPAPAGNVPNGAPTNQRTVAMLEAGTYYVSVRDLLTDCRSTPTQVVIDSVNIVYPDVLIQQSILQLSCDPSTGTAELRATADSFDDTNPTYTFTWFNSLDGSGTTVIDPWPGSQSTVGNLTSGNYSVTAFNATTGCSTTELFIVPPFDPKFFPAMALSGDPQSSCLINNGSVVARVLPFPVVNGLTYSPPYNFRVDLYSGNQLAAGLNVEPPPVAPDIANLPALPFAPQPGSFIAEPLDDGIYTVRLIDLNTGCIVVDTTSIANDRRRPIPDVDLENPLTNCDTRLNGQLSATADGRPVSDYDFFWWSALTNPPALGDTLSTQHKLIGQGGGDYFVNIVNRASGCDTLAQGTIPVEQVLPFAPSIQVIQPNTICWEDFFPQEPLARPNGWLRANVNNETAGYRFEWFTGELTNDQASIQTPDTIGINNIHLISQEYTVRAVLLSTGCSNVRTELVPDARVLPLGEVQTTPSYCPDVSPTLTGTGSVLLTVTNSENVVMRSIQWFDESNNASIGDGVQVFEVSPGFYRAEFLTNEFCYGEAVGEVRTEILSYNLVSANGDSNNDTWIIDCISNYPNNNVKVFNRYGVMVYEADGYDNADTVFRGIGERGVYSMGNDLPDGTYFYIIDKRDGSKPITGFLELVR